MSSRGKSYTRWNVAHPKRLMILAAVGADGRQSPNELAQATAMPLGVVAYHVRAMAEAGLVELVDERRVRGAIEHFYRVTPAAADEVHALAELACSASRALVRPAAEVA